MARLPAREDFFGKYELLRRVAQGGQGDVWEVRDFELRRCVAMKRLNAQATTSEAAVHRFLAEAQIASQLEHPGILPIFDVGLDPDGRPFYTTQLLPGTTLADVLCQSRDASDAEWTIHRVLELLLRVCEVMAHAHSRGVIHRDLKPSNVLVGPFGDVRVIDWGSAHVCDKARKDFEQPFVPLDRPVIQTDRGEAIWGEPDSPLATAKAGQPITVLFMPPEILRGQTDELGPQTDIYSLGVVLYELLAGWPPYSRPDGSLPERGELQGLISRGPPTPIRNVNHAVSRDLAAIGQKAMAYSKADRYGSMPELADDIRAALTLRPVKARKPGLVLKFQKWAQRNAGYVLVTCVSLMVIAASFYIVRGLRAERNVARQLTALRSAELETRSGHWRKALEHWDEAEDAGYTDSVHLSLRRAEAWTVLVESDRSGALLRELAARADLGDQRGPVLLRLGEHELFDGKTYERGVQHVRDALAAGLRSADLAFANGLLAESTPKALEYFQQALQLDPYHHGAHRHSLGLQFALGRREEFEAHVRVFKVLYPDDHSPGFLEAAQVAVRGDLAAAQAKLQSLQNLTSPEVWKEMNSACRALAAVSKYYDLDAFLSGGQAKPPSRDELGVSPGAPFALGDAPGVTFTDTAIRIPRLPCVRQGLLEGSDAIRSLLIPFVGDIDSSIERIRSSWRHHPEAFVPAFAGMFLESRHPTNGIKSLPVLRLQAELYQMSADSPSFMPGLAKLARYLAAKAHFELARADLTNFQALRESCLENIRNAGKSSVDSALQSEAYFKLAFELHDHDLSRTLLVQWERDAPADPKTGRAGVELDIASGATTAALDRIDALLANHPGDAWAREKRQVIVEQLKKLLDESKNPPDGTK